MKIIFCFILLALKAVQGNVKPHFTVQPNAIIEAYYGDSVNFTWAYSDHPIYQIGFGLFNTEFNTLGNYILIVNETYGHSLTKEKKVRDLYQGRLRFLGDRATRTITIELSDIRYTDKKYYGLEVEFENGDMIENATKLVVKTPSSFTASPGSQSLLRGNKALFPWKYSLNEEDTSRLKSISFGFYRQSTFHLLCYIEVSAMKTNCSLGKAKVASMDIKNSITFEISHLELNDEATYALRLGGTLRPMENQSRIIVQDRPQFIKQPQSLTLKEHETLTLDCIASGKPVPHITWYKDGHVIQEKFTGTFTINDTRKEDAGKYHCVAGNMISNITSSTATVDIQYSPIINTTSKFSVIHAPMGRKVKLNCPSIANPPASVSWDIHNQLYGRQRGQYLEVTITNKRDYGNYTCRATNSLGEDHAWFLLEEVGPPTKPKVYCETQAMQSTRAIFRWLAPEDDGGAPVLVYTVKRRKLVSGQHDSWIKTNASRTWYMFPLEWESTIEFTVTAWNIYGESKHDPDNSCIFTNGKDPSLNKITSTATSTVGTVGVGAFGGSQDDKTVVVYIGISIALLALIAVVVMLIIYRTKKNRRKNNWSNHQNLSYDRVLGIDGNTWNGATADDKLLGSLQRTRKHTMVGSPSYQLDPEWNIPREKICIMKVIGNGAFGLVYKGRVHGVGSNTVGWSIVAIKSPYADATDAEVRDLMKEFELLKTLKPHPHVIKLLGCGEDEGRPLVIIEYVPFGDLLGYLRKSRGEDDDYYSDPEIKPNTNLSSQQLIRFAWHVADGMTYLASEKIIHRDLAARNVLVGEGLSCKVTDFGMARDVSNDDIYLRTTEGRLPVKWTAIEALTGSGEYTTQSDVWSFGVVLYEICTIGADPYPGINGKEIPERLGTGYRMPRPGHVDPELYDIMMSCWKTDAAERPTFPELKEKLIKLESVQSRDYINLNECLYQNVAVSSTRGANRRSFLDFSKNPKKEQAPKGNDYTEEPTGGLRNVVTAV